MSPSLESQLSRIRHIALDLDGTIYRGGTLFDCTKPFLSLLSDLGIGFTFVTNNSSKSVKDYVQHLARLGLTATVEEIYTSTDATIEFLREEMPVVRRLFVLGTPSMRAEIESAGFVATTDNPDDAPDAVLVGFDTSLNFSRLCRAAYWIKQGKPFLATNPDRVCPTDEATVLVDCGAICAALTEAVGRPPDAVLGKPNPRMLRGLLNRLQLEPDEMAMVGDRLYTDIEMARRVGSPGVLVLTGEATPDDVARHPFPVLLVVADLAEFGKKLAHDRKRVPASENLGHR